MRLNPGIFRQVGKGLATGSVVAAGIGFVYVSPAAASDPCLSFFRELDEIDEKMRAVRTVEEEDLILPRVNELNTCIYQGAVPRATTAEGAAAALRYAIECDHLERHELHLVKIALAYLEGRAA